MSLVSSIVSSPSSSSPSATRNLTFILLMICFYFVSYLVAIVECSDNNITITKIKAPLHHPLTIDYYSKTCPQLDDLVGSVTGPRFKQTPVAGPATIRLFFHDCFVEGCDASILIAPGAEGSALVERNMPENKNLPPEGFETVEMAKKVVESKCPGAVSCADILAIAARDFIHLAGGPYYKVKKGRKDSKKSKPFKVKYHLPRSNSSISSLLSLFSSKGLTARDLVALSRARLIGFAHCDQFLDRLYNYQSTGRPDPSVDPDSSSPSRCTAAAVTGGNGDVVSPLDVQTPFAFDNGYYGNLENKLGVLGTDQGLWLDPRTKDLVEEMGREKGRFFEAFVEGMDKMGSHGVKRGRKGEIRRECGKHLS
ncbi:LOW QUALITY PROTEIN: peroxidase 19-like [Asparagus officinalis]|uniref:LOW QUALITY PROTEIN: peroxidase 19-like n=1 Tax=Asparagus officinalis TaxID=4686 RepID=UPI00098E5B0E|nr:LOW QUALITY PROTEIN: peroxidase 19-like [Asparagus officinalis]